MPHVSPQLLRKYLPDCLGKEIEACVSPLVVNCPHIAQICALVLDRLGMNYHIIEGVAQKPSGEWVEHFWIDIVGTNIRIETNPLEMRRNPKVIEFLNTNYKITQSTYMPQSDFPELLDKIPPEQVEAFHGIADTVATCILEAAGVTAESGKPCAYCETPVPRGSGIWDKTVVYCDEDCQKIYGRIRAESTAKDIAHRAGYYSQQRPATDTDRRYHGGFNE